ncbi:unnamed protein product [Linum tenue]|uniref:Protein SMG7L n=1 Tax=Linum tenue TaxID=586396 RepID=A0AAV0PDP8_9ROSI|nr:unnamed protein product [Linum tenue]
MESSNSKNHHVEKSPLLKEVADLETQFLGMIHSSKVLWHSEVQLQYKKICSCYEKLLVLGDHKLEELQDVEYSLWKLHYRLIDEFRKRLRRIPDNGEPTAESVDGFKSFLSVASLYYQNLILNLRKNYGLQESFTLGSRNGGMQDKKLQFLWHRFLVCLGDLARYKEQQCKKSGQPNWSVPASQYLQATMVWPFNGNPHNQLAVLATYVGDEFLALYHCIRSLAVKEPFPDAWNNLLLLCEENRSSPLASISSDADFDFLKQASSGQMTSDCKVMKEQEEESSNGANLWVLIIRVISFFLIDSSLEEFPSTFASTIKELETLLSLDDTKLKATMESYHYMDSTRKEPFRTLQVVCILIFVIEHLKNRKEEVKESMQWALTSAFMIMGRLVDRCSKATPSSSCTLSPAVLIFIEWLETTFGDVEKYGSDDRTTVTIAISYFFSSLHELLKKLDAEKNEGDECEFNRPLWEDQELRGFAPIAPSCAALDFFSTHHQGPADSFESGKRIRACRIINAAKKISERSNGDQNWFTYDSCRQTIDAEEGIASVASTDNGTAVTDEKSSNHRANGKSAAGFLDEEEVILFKPLTRHNSEPIYKSSSDSFEDPMSPSREAGNQAVAADECLRRATSLLMAQYQAQGDNNNNGLPFHSDLTNFRRNNNFQQPMNDTLTSMFSEPSISPSFGSTIAAGPPSLNAWVSPSSFSHEKARGKTVKQTLAPIEEAVAASSSLRELSLSEPEENTATISGHSPYSSPLPSAPFLPDDDGATWLRNGNIPMLPPPHFSDHQQTSAGFSNWNGPPYDYTYYPPGFTYPPPQQQRRMTSAEWLRQYRENNPRANDHMWQPPSYASHVSPDQQWGIPPPLVYDHPPLMMQMGFPQVHGYLPSRQGLYGESPSLNEPEPLLQYLKEKEWLIHHKDSNFRGPSFMGS